MKIIVIGATGTIGSEVVKALSQNKHEVVRASRSGEVKVNIDDPPTIRALFDKVQGVDAVICCAGNATFKPFSELTDADYELGLRSKLTGQVSVAKNREGSSSRTRFDSSDHRCPRDAPDARKCIDLACQCRPGRLCTRRRTGNAARPADQCRQSSVGQGDDGQVRHGPHSRASGSRCGEGLRGGS